MAGYRADPRITPGAPGAVTLRDAATLKEFAAGVLGGPERQRLQPQLPPQQPPPEAEGPLEGMNPPELRPPTPAITEINRRVSALWHMGQATASALAAEVIASKRASQPWQRYSCSGIALQL